MSSRSAIQRYLQQELSRPDPWRLGTSAFDTARYQTMLEFARSDRPYMRGLEVGCAAGAFTERVAPLCREWLVIDVVQAAIERASARLKGNSNIEWHVADIVTFRPQKSFDLIIVSEVLYYLRGRENLVRAVGNLFRLMAPGGVLIFGSATDAACARWGLRGGAETCIREFSLLFRETARVHHRGASPNEDCVIVRYTR
jgi:SAM-dependent methyltransferase